MALKITVKKQKDEQEIDVQYWEIEELYFNQAEKYLLCELRGYESKNKRTKYVNTGVKTDEYRFRFSMSGANFPDITKRDFIKDIFAYIKTQNKYGINWAISTEEN